MAEHAKSNGVALGHFGAPLIPTKVTLAYAKGAGFEWGSDAAFDMLDCNSLASGDADVINTTLQLILPCLDNVKVLASVTGERISLTPDSPTIGEVNPDLALALWNGPLRAQGHAAGRSRQDHRRGGKDRDERAGAEAGRRNRCRRPIGRMRNPPPPRSSPTSKRSTASTRPCSSPGTNAQHRGGDALRRCAAGDLKRWNPVKIRRGQEVLPFNWCFCCSHCFCSPKSARKPDPRRAGNFAAQPRLWPAIGVGGMLLFGLAQIAATWRSRAPGAIPEMFHLGQGT